MRGWGHDDRDDRRGHDDRDDRRDDRKGGGRGKGQQHRNLSWTRPTNGVQAPTAANPFAPAPVGGGGGGGGFTLRSNDGPDCPTGPTLGAGSELSRVYNMPDTMGHNDAVDCLAMIGDKVYSGGRDNQLMVWRGVPSGDGVALVEDTTISLTSNVNSLHYDPTSKWLFCGLWSGDIQAFCQEPFAQDTLQGHRRCASSVVVHSGVVVSGSNDGTVRLWTFNPQANKFQAHAQRGIDNPSGPVSVVKVFNNNLWVGAQQGITCFDLNSLAPVGTIASQVPVTGMAEFQGHMIVTYRNGDVKVLDGTGTETFSHPAVGEHTTNTSCAIMMHPVVNKPMLLCGQVQGYVTAYDLPEFTPRGSWCCTPGSDVRAIVDAGAGGMFFTAGLKGDIMMWKWGVPGQGSVGGGGGVGAGTVVAGAVTRASNPFAPVPGGMS